MIKHLNWIISFWRPLMVFKLLHAHLHMMPNLPMKFHQSPFCSSGKLQLYNPLVGLSPFGSSQHNYIPSHISKSNEPIFLKNFIKIL